VDGDGLFVSVADVEMRTVVAIINSPSPYQVEVPMELFCFAFEQEPYHCEAFLKLPVATATDLSSNDEIAENDEGGGFNQSP
jgi:hypothetical protein